MALPPYLKKSAYSAIAFFGTLCALSAGYAAYTALGTVTSGQTLTATGWNAMVADLADLDGRWARAGSDLVFTGGNVGIGVTSPLSKLHVNLGTNKNIVFNTDSSVGTNESRISATNDAYTASTPLWINGSYLGFQTNGTERMRLDASGYLGVGVAPGGWSTNARLSGQAWNNTWAISGYFNGTNGGAFLSRVDSTSGNLMALYYGSSTVVGSITTNGSSSFYNTSSDARLKKDIEPVTDALGTVEKIGVRSFRFKTQDENQSKTIGFIAQQLKPIAPYAVTGDENRTDADGNPVYMSVDYGKLTPLLTASIQELKEKLDKKDAEMAELRKEIETLRASIQN